MLPIRKNDTVSLASGNGRVLDIIATDLGVVYKVQKLTDREVIYLEARLMQLERQCFKSRLTTFLKEVVNFIAYTLHVSI